MLPVTQFCMISSYAATLVILFLYVALVLRDSKVLRNFSQINLILIGYILLLFYTFYSFCTGEQYGCGISCVYILSAFVFLNLRILYFIVKINKDCLARSMTLILIVPVVSCILIYLFLLLFHIDFQVYSDVEELFTKGSPLETGFAVLIFTLYVCYFTWVHYYFFKQSPELRTGMWNIVYLIFNFAICIFFIGISFNVPFFLTGYYYLLISFVFYIVYSEIFKNEPAKAAKVLDSDCVNTRNKMFCKLEKYMNETKAWRDPDITMSSLVRYVSTNRTTFALIMKENGFDSYSCYINQYRVKDFIDLYNCNRTENYQDLFYDAGFRSRATALRNFKQITGMTPSEYFRLNHQEQVACH